MPIKERLQRQKEESRSSARAGSVVRAICLFLVGSFSCNPWLAASCILSFRYV